MSKVSQIGLIGAKAEGKCCWKIFQKSSFLDADSAQVKSVYNFLFFNAEMAENKLECNCDLLVHLILLVKRRKLLN